MAEGKRLAALSIGVADAPPLPYLRGAVNGAKAFHDWSEALGYEARLVTDETEPVTLGRLRAELEAVLVPTGGSIHRLILYFAGHGLIREAEEGLWLLSDWHAQLRAVAVEALKRRLYRYGIMQIAIIADACRLLPPDIDTADLASDPVLGRGPISSVTTPAIDKFIAAQDGTKTYMVPGETPEEDRCIFSGVLLEGLWGAKPAAFSSLEREKVTSRSLGAYLQSEVPLIAKRYKTELHPNVSPTFPEGDDVYFAKGGSPPPSSLPPWPPAESLAALAATSGDHLEAVRPTTAPNPPKRRGGLLFQRRAPRSEVFEPMEPPFEVLRDAVLDYGTAESGVVAIELAETKVEQLWAHASDIGRSEAPTVVYRGKWGSIRIGMHPRTIRPALGAEAWPTLIEFDDGLYAAAPVLSGLSALLRYERARGVTTLVYHSGHQLPPFSETLAERTIQKMERGALRADDVTDLALEMRGFKHIDPILGVIAAYLYDSIGDVDSIRRMAYYYIHHQQSIPYDIALLAQLPAQKRGRSLWLTVPDVPERKPRTNAEKEVNWSYAATPAAKGVIGGLWPWMRQGWAFLEDATEDESTLILPGLEGLVEHLTPGRFTTFDQEGAKGLIDIVGLQPILSPPPTQAPPEMVL